MAPAPVASGACHARRTAMPPLRMAPLAAPSAPRPASVCRSQAARAAAATPASFSAPAAAPHAAAAAAAAAASRRRHGRRAPLAPAAALTTTTTTDLAAPSPSVPDLAAAAASAAAAAPSCRLVKDVAVAVQRTSITSRVLVAAVDIAAPPSAVWGALTDYERLAEFIPSLERNECLARDPEGGTARLRQVGAQDVAMGVKFRAAVTLDIREHTGPGGIPAGLVTSSTDSRDYLGKKARFPAPVTTTSLDGDEDADGEGRAALVEAAQAMEGAGAVASALSTLMSVDEDDEALGGGLGGGGGVGAGVGGAPGAASPSPSPPVVRTRRSWPRDISFELVEGDFSAFRGVWRVSEGPAGPLTARLAYSVFVQPQAFLPVGLIQGRISRDVATNLKSVRAYAEEVVFEKILRQQQEKEKQQQQEADAVV